MCKGDISWQMDEEDENIALLSELKQTNPKKLKRYVLICVFLCTLLTE